MDKTSSVWNNGKYFSSDIRYQNPFSCMFFVLKTISYFLQRGISSLLRSKQVFNTHYHSASIEFYRLDKEIRLHLSLSLVVDRPQNPRPHENFARTVLGSLALFPCHLSKTTNINIWNVTTWSTIHPEGFNSLKIIDIPTMTDEEPKLIFTPIKYMGGMQFKCYLQ